MAEMKTRVLLVSSSIQSAHLVRQSLARAGSGEYEVAQAHQLSQAITQLQRTPADVVLLESSLPDAAGLDALRQLAAKVRGVRVLMLVRPSEVDLARQAVGAGALGYLVKDAQWELDGDRINRAIEGVRGWTASGATPGPAGGRNGRVLAFLGAKGGTGTTSVALDVAHLIHEQGSTVALVEFRATPGTLPRMLGLPADRHLRAILSHDPAEIDETMVEQAMVSPRPGMKILFSPHDDRSVAEIGREHAQSLIAVLRRIADFVVLDLPRDGSAATQVAVQAANFVTLVTESDHACIRQARCTLDMLRGWSVSFARVGAVIVFRPRSVDTSLAELRAAVGCEILSIIPVPRGRRLTPYNGSGPAPARTDSFALSLLELSDRLLRPDVTPIPVQPAAA
jgi:pilus assembly protein CpaE